MVGKPHAGPMAATLAESTQTSGAPPHRGDRKRFAHERPTAKNFAGLDSSTAVEKTTA